MLISLFTQQLCICAVSVVTLHVRTSTLYYAACDKHRPSVVLFRLSIYQILLNTHCAHILPLNVSNSQLQAGMCKQYKGLNSELLLQVVDPTSNAMAASSRHLSSQNALCHHPEGIPVRRTNHGGLWDTKSAACRTCFTDMCNTARPLPSGSIRIMTLFACMRLLGPALAGIQACWQHCLIGCMKYRHSLSRSKSRHTTTHNE